MAKAKGTITIDEEACTSCGYCANVCNQDSLAWPSERFNSKGYVVALFVKPDTCTGCGLCGWMCPELAIRVFKSTAVAAA